MYSCVAQRFEPILPTIQSFISEKNVDVKLELSDKLDTEPRSSEQEESKSEEQI